MTSEPRAAPDQQEIELEAETVALVDSLDARLEHLDLFTLLEADLNADRAVLQRAYFKRSLCLHPDRYFNRKLGPYKKKLERVFAVVAAAYEFLKDDRRRAAYRKKILNARGDNQATWGGGVVAVETPQGLQFVVADEASFFGLDEGAALAPPQDEGATETESGKQPDGRQVALPRKQYALPRLRRPASGAPPAAPPEPAVPPERASASPDVEAMLRDFLKDK